jgi:hypothetical protein
VERVLELRRKLAGATVPADKELTGGRSSPPTGRLTHWYMSCDREKSPKRMWRGYGTAEEEIRVADAGNH